jgi:hypothetical protein
MDPLPESLEELGEGVSGLPGSRLAGSHIRDPGPFVASLPGPRISPVAPLIAEVVLEGGPTVTPGEIIASLRSKGTVEVPDFR